MLMMISTTMMIIMVMLLIMIFYLFVFLPFIVSFIFFYLYVLSFVHVQLVAARCPMLALADVTYERQGELPSSYIYI